MKAKEREERVANILKENAADRELTKTRGGISSVRQALPRDDRPDILPVTLDPMGIRRAEAETAAEKAAREAEEKEIQGYKDRQAERLEHMRQLQQESRERRLSPPQAAASDLVLSDAPPVPTLQQQQALDYLHSHSQRALPSQPLTHMIVAGEKPVQETGQAGGGDDLNARFVASQQHLLEQAHQPAAQLPQPRDPSVASNGCSFWTTAVVGASGVLATSFALAALSSPSLQTITLQQVLTAMGLKITLGAAVGATSALSVILVAGLVLLAVAGVIGMYFLCAGDNRSAVVPNRTV